MSMRSPTKSTHPTFFRRYGWFFLFLLCTFLGYFYAMDKKNAEIASMDLRRKIMEKDKELALIAKEDLLMRLHSQSDPHWVEMVLMKELGVVPEGKMKVHFTKKDKR